jgi:hypothetical protein
MLVDDFFQDTNNGPEFKYWQIQKIFLIQRPDWLCGTESLLLNGLRGYFPGVKDAVLEFYCSPQSTC